MPLITCAGVSQQKGFSIPAALFVLVVVAMLGTAMVSILNQGTASIAREVVSIRALMAAESGAERGLYEVLESNPAACTGTMLNPPASLNPLIVNWQLVASGMTSCEVNVSCALTQVDTDSDGTLEDYFTLRSEATCGPAADRAFRIVEVQARG